MSKQASSQATANDADHAWKTTPPQGKYWKTWFTSIYWALAFVAGFGSGKSEIMHYIAVMIIVKFPWANVALYAPTYDLIKLNNQPRIAELLDHFGLEWTFNKQDFIFYIKGHGKIICRSMDNPSRIIAYEVFASLVDELDTMPQTRAEEAWHKIISRNRQQPPLGSIIPKDSLVQFIETEEFAQLPADTMHTGLFDIPNKVGVFTTPEGFKFTYKKWEKEENEGYFLVRAATESNPHLTKAYIANLRASYPPQLIEAYLNGEFVNLTGGACYHCFDRRIHHFEFNDAANDEYSNVVSIG